ncbi:MAG TPA: MOSC N-terminal beta barrel domain-containing protein [Candidatus Rubrimentiphilum sp.]|nr:MOSC N-terminal beta barrel domain-containing protein [Candidatus Rubrimentiphilum sp.]
MQLLGHVHAIYRYPVKSLAGESLNEVTIDADGIPGDRAAALFVTAGHARTGKTYRGKEHNLLHLTSDPREAAELAKAGGVTVELRRGDHFFDAAPVSLLFDRWVEEVSAALGRPLDFRRWRPNLFAHAAEDFQFSESDLNGALIEAGTAILRVSESDKRCVTTTYDVETGEADPEVLRYVAQERDSVLGVYCDVELAGVVRAGDALRLRAR